MPFETSQMHPSAVPLLAHPLSGAQSGCIAYPPLRSLAPPLQSGTKYQYALFKYETIGFRLTKLPLGYL